MWWEYWLGSFDYRQPFSFVLANWGDLVSPHFALFVPAISVCVWNKDAWSLFYLVLIQHGWLLDWPFNFVLGFAKFKLKSHFWRLEVWESATNFHWLDWIDAGSNKVLGLDQVANTCVWQTGCWNQTHYLAALLGKHYVTVPASTRGTLRAPMKFILNLLVVPFQLSRSSFWTQSNLLIFCFTP